MYGEFCLSYIKDKVLFVVIMLLSLVFFLSLLFSIHFEVLVIFISIFFDVVFIYEVFSLTFVPLFSFIVVTEKEKI
jgi:hypothetical protein